MTAIQCQPKRIVKFYGPLAKALKRRSFSAVGLNSASEVMRCLLSNFPQLGSHMRERHYRVVMNGRAISKDELDDPVGDNHEIHIIPAICGAGGGPLTSILTGVALIGAGLLFPFAAPFLTPLGIGLALQGVAQLISPTPNDTPESTDPSDRSYNFSNIQQTSREGVPVPLVYGDIVTGSVVLSVNIEKDEEELGGGADALFEGGTGNPNPDPNPVPDPDPDPDDPYGGGTVIGPILMAPVSDIRVPIGMDFGIRKIAPDAFHCFPPYQDQVAIFGGTFDRIASTGYFLYGKAVRVTLVHGAATGNAICSVNQGDPAQSINPRTVTIGKVEIYEYRAAGINYPGWTDVTPGLTSTFSTQQTYFYADSTTQSSYIYRLYFNGWLTVPASLSVPSDFSP